MKRENVYIKEFDSLRAISVIMVIVAHYLGRFPSLSILSSAGVTMFFVISGFLITQILLHEKEKFGLSGVANLSKLLAVLKVFYIRRALRIFPLYYLVLVILVVANIDRIREFWEYYFFYTTNFLYSFETIKFDRLTYFWSLAVEEQFYLVWPLLLLIIPVKWVSVTFFSILAGGSFIFKFWLLFLYWPSGIPAYFMMPSCIEAFALGAIALLVLKKSVKIESVKLLCLLSLCLFILLQLFHKDSFWSGILSGIGRTVFSLFSAIVLVIIVGGYYGKWTSYVLNNRVLLFCGKISYGIYIYHNLVPKFLKYVLEKADIDLRGNGKILIASVLCTICVASISYFLYELPINKTKKAFSY